MTDLLERAVASARLLPEEQQDEIARAILALAGDASGLVAMSDDEREAIARSRAAAARGEFASADDVAAVWSKHGL